MIFSDKQKKIREFTAGTPALQEILNEILQVEMKGQ